MSEFTQSVKHSVARNISDVTSLVFWKAVLAETLGTLILVFVGCATCLDDFQNNPATTVAISLTFGLAVATVVWCIGHVSGGHINPAVTVAMLLTRRITLIRGVVYVIAQCAGAVAGAAIVFGIHPDNSHEYLGATMISDSLNPGRVGKGFAIELLITFILVLTVFASCDKGRTDHGGNVPLAIGLSITLCHLFAIKYTGASMNPARSFGPALVKMTGTPNSRDGVSLPPKDLLADHWVYWLGPILGGIIAGFLYDFVFAVDASLSKVKTWAIPRPPNSKYSTNNPDTKDGEIPLENV